MSTAEQFHFDLTVERFAVKDVLRAVLHTILFQRVFGSIGARTIEYFDLSFPAVTDKEVDKLVEEKVDHFWGHVETKGQILVSLLEKRTRKQWFSTSEEKVPFEQWYINVEVAAGKTERERMRLHAVTSSQLSAFLVRLVSFVDAKTAHIPPIVTAEVHPFPISIAVIKL